MDIIKRNTDYALRLLNLMAGFYRNKEAVSARILSNNADVPYPVTCKLLQKLQKNRLVKSVMGPRGGYLLCRDPEQISFLDVIETIQGPVSVNRCFLGNYQCPMKENCALHVKLSRIQNEIVNSFQRCKIADSIPNKNVKLENAV